LTESGETKEAQSKSSVKSLRTVAKLYCKELRMIDLSEPLIPLRDVPHQPFIPRRRKGSKLNVATVWRWAQRGLNGHRLETLRCGGVTCTSRAALLDFFRRITGAQREPFSPAKNQRRQERVEAELQKEGL
jgi:hypothetical protein